MSDWIAPRTAVERFVTAHESGICSGHLPATLLAELEAADV